MERDLQRTVNAASIRGSLLLSSELRFKNALSPSHEARSQDDRLARLRQTYHMVPSTVSSQGMMNLLCICRGCGKAEDGRRLRYAHGQ